MVFAFATENYFIPLPSLPSFLPTTATTVREADEGQRPKRPLAAGAKLVAARPGLRPPAILCLFG